MSERDDGDHQILAESALQGERIVAWLRLLTWCLLGVASAGVGRATGEAQETSAVRAGVVFG